MFADLCNELEARLSGVVGLTFDRHSPQTLRNGKPPRIVWVPGGDSFEGATPGGNPRPILTRKVVINCHIWGSDYTQAESLMHLLIVAAHKAFTLIEVGPTQNLPSASDTLTQGFLIVLPISTAIPVTEALQPIAQATTFTPTISTTP